MGVHLITCFLSSVSSSLAWASAQSCASGYSVACTRLRGASVDIEIYVGVLCGVYVLNAATVVAVGSREAW